MKIFWPLLTELILLTLGVSLITGCHGNGRLLASGASLQDEMDAYCRAKMNDHTLSKLSTDDKKGQIYEAFFSRRLHTCLQSFATVSDKNAGAMDYVLSDLTYGFLSPPKWHPFELPLHVTLTTYGRHHHIYAEGYWARVDADAGHTSAVDANSVTLTCDYGDNRSGEQANSCTETEGYVQFGTVHTDTQTYHIASWGPDEIIATDSEEGLFGSTRTTLLIHPEAKEIEIVDGTRMNEKQPDLMKGLAGKSYSDHYVLHGGMYSLSTASVLFQCDEDGVVINMRLDVAEKHHGDVYDLPEAEWNAGSKASNKYNSQQCEIAMKKKLNEFR